MLRYSLTSKTRRIGVDLCVWDRHNGEDTDVSRKGQVRFLALGTERSYIYLVGV